MVALSWAFPTFVHAHEAVMPKPEDISRIAPGLDKYSKGPLSDLWKRPQLSPRDRSVVTLAGLIARNQTIEMPHHLRLALDNGVKPSEISEIITHLAFYAGRANALSAIVVTQDVFAERKIAGDQLSPASPSLLPIDEATERNVLRASVSIRLVAPGIVAVHDDILSVTCAAARACARDRS